ncbi:MAG: hypothetical protein ACE5LD_02795 [Candidatus Bipolaricaulia bacterium]
MKNRGLWLGLLLLALLLTLASCGPRALSPQAYRGLVIKTLQGGELEKGTPPLPGLIPAIKKLFGALYCAESSCKMPSEMAYLSDVADFERVVVEEHRSRICNKKVHPPQEMEADHEQVCNLLEGIRGDVEAMKLTATMAAQLLAQNMNDPETLERVSQSYSAKIMERKPAIVEALRRLREISWLASVFTGAESEIPELRTETKQEAD